MKIHTLYLMDNQYSAENWIRFDVKSNLDIDALMMVLRPHYKWDILPARIRWWASRDIKCKRQAKAESLEAAIQMLHTEDFNMYTEKTVTRTKEAYIPLELNSMVTVSRSVRYGEGGGNILLLTPTPQLLSTLKQTYKTEAGCRQVIRALIAAKLDEECGEHIKLWNHRIQKTPFDYAVPTLDHYILIREIPENVNLKMHNDKLCIRKEVTYTEVVKELVEPTAVCHVDIYNHTIGVNSKYYSEK